MKCPICEEKLNLGGICPRCGADYGGVNVELLRAVNKFELRTAELLARLFEGDPHQWSKRPCPTCRPISELLGRPFGCVKERGEKKS